jgi:hypothetical protein
VLEFEGLGQGSFVGFAFIAFEVVFSGRVLSWLESAERIFGLLVFLFEICVNGSLPRKLNGEKHTVGSELFFLSQFSFSFLM